MEIRFNWLDLLYLGRTEKLQAKGLAYQYFTQSTEMDTNDVFDLWGN